MGARRTRLKRPKLQAGQLADGSEYHYYRKPVTRLISIATKAPPSKKKPAKAKAKA